MSPKESDKLRQVDQKINVKDLADAYFQLSKKPGQQKPQGHKPPPQPSAPKGRWIFILTSAVVGMMIIIAVVNNLRRPVLRRAVSRELAQKSFERMRNVIPKISREELRAKLEKAKKAQELSKSQKPKVAQQPPRLSPEEEELEEALERDPEFKKRWEEYKKNFVTLTNMGQQPPPRPEIPKRGQVKEREFEPVVDLNDDRPFMDLND